MAEVESAVWWDSHKGEAGMSTQTEVRTDATLLAHLYRRAGFGATRDQIDRLTTRDYAEAVEFLLNPRPEVGVADDLIGRYLGGEPPHTYLATWLFRMINSENQLQEKMALFWHHVFATGLTKNEHARPRRPRSSCSGATDCPTCGRSASTSRATRR